MLRVNKRMEHLRQHQLQRAQVELENLYDKEKLRRVTLTQIAKDQTALRAYPGLEKCDMGKVSEHVVAITPASVTPEEIEAARQIRLAGEEFIEDHAAGEATRLGLGTKFLLTPEQLAQAIMLHNLRKPNEVIPLSVSPSKVSPISLGIRHKLQAVFDLVQMAVSSGLNPTDVLKNQWTLTVLNEETSLTITREMLRFNFLGLDPERTLFMVQEKGAGMNLFDGQLAYDPRSEYRLYNHGDLKKQQTLEGKVFFLRFKRHTGEVEQKALLPNQLEAVLDSMKNMTAYPAEDLDYLTGSFDPANLAVALKLGRQQFRMVMEAVAQKEPPQKGGFFTFDPARGKVVCVESDAGGTVVVESDPASLARIAYLNKNFSMFPNPGDAFRALAAHEMPAHLTVKGNALYSQTPQGDQNFNLPTAVIMKSPVKPIRSLKALADGTATMEAFAAQDKQPGFLDLARQYSVI